MGDHIYCALHRTGEAHKGRGVRRNDEPISRNKNGTIRAKIRDRLWQTHNAHVVHEITGKMHVLGSEVDSTLNENLSEILKNLR